MDWPRARHLAAFTLLGAPFAVPAAFAAMVFAAHPYWTWMPRQCSGCTQEFVSRLAIPLAWFVILQIVSLVGLGLQLFWGRIVALCTSAAIIGPPVGSLFARSNSDAFWQTCLSVIGYSLIAGALSGDSMARRFERGVPWHNRWVRVARRLSTLRFFLFVQASALGWVLLDERWERGAGSQWCVLAGIVACSIAALGGRKTAFVPVLPILGSLVIAVIIGRRDLHNDAFESAALLATITGCIGVAILAWRDGTQSSRAPDRDIAIKDSSPPADLGLSGRAHIPKSPVSRQALLLIATAGVAVGLAAWRGQHSSSLGLDSTLIAGFTTSCLSSMVCLLSLGVVALVRAWGERLDRSGNASTWTLSRDKGGIRVRDDQELRYLTFAEIGEVIVSEGGEIAKRFRLDGEGAPVDREMDILSNHPLGRMLLIYDRSGVETLCACLPARSGSAREAELISAIEAYPGTRKGTHGGYPSWLRRGEASLRDWAENLEAMIAQGRSFGPYRFADGDTRTMVRLVRDIQAPVELRSAALFVAIRTGSPEEVRPVFDCVEASTAPLMLAMAWMGDPRAVPREMILDACPYLAEQDREELQGLLLAAGNRGTIAQTLSAAV